MNDRLTFSEWLNIKHSIDNNINFALTIIGKLKEAITSPDTYETMKKLEILLNKYNGKKSNTIYKFALNKYKRLKAKEASLIKEKKSRLANKYADDSNIESDIKTLSITREELDILLADLYASYVDTKKFIKKCKALKKILVKFLSTYKATGNTKLYKKYYSNYIDVCEFLRTNKI